MIPKYPRQMAMLFAATALAVALPTAFEGQEYSRDSQTSTPIKHVVVLFQENVSFDHYFGTYPYATNPAGEPEFHADKNTPRANNLLSGGLLDQNSNSTQPFRLDRTQAWTCDQNHDYTPEQQAFDHGLMDKFPQYTGTGGTDYGVECDYGHGTGLVMGYYDGNTVTAWWNYAQHYALSDNFYGTMFGPSSVGALNLAAGTTSGLTVTGLSNTTGTIANGATSGVLIGDIDPGLDDCSTSSKHATVTGAGINIGVLLNDANITWGWFQGGFAPTTAYNGTTVTKAVCGSTSTGIPPSAITDYVSHHNPFDYFAQTANPHHLPPTGPIGKTDQANHQYDLSLLLTSIAEGNLPAVSFVKAKAFQNGHPGNSDPLDEQTWLVTAVNAIENSRYWNDTAIIITYDDSDGWYDHQMDTVVNQSSAQDDELAGPGSCGTTPDGGNPGRCGYGPRLPLIVISRYAKSNYIDHRMTDQSSVIRFIEDNWKLPRIGGDSSDVKAGSLFGFFDFDHHSAPRITLDTTTGQVVSKYVE
ncbi:MAG: phospholipase C [Terriglobia bacterium]